MRPMEERALVQENSVEEEVEKASAFKWRFTVQRSTDIAMLIENKRFLLFCKTSSSILNK